MRYRLPDGTCTDDPEQHADAWLELGKRCESFFPGYVADAFNPDIRLTLWIKNRWGGDMAASHVNLDLQAVEALLGIKLRKGES